MATSHLLAVLLALPALLPSVISSSENLLIIGKAQSDSQTLANTLEAVPNRRQAIPTELPGTWTGGGCFIDKPAERILAALSYSSATSMTIESCLAFCQAAGYPYAGVEWSQECYCDYAIETDFADIYPTDCNMACSGNSSELCGGSQRINIFHDPNGAPTPVSKPTGWTKEGCWQDFKFGGQLLLPWAYNVPAVTNAKCVQTCSDLGYNYAGTEFGHECYCGNTTFVGSVQEKGDGFCHMACLGDTTDACGGYSHVSLYKRPGVVGGWP